ncbi:MAG: glutamate-1-semialdehyde 2,1-aminomutase, partial [Gemmatimonadetes bacterium]|nr:glutamate-1-semialdehyde 2,1-aminomutase [Gemmatimonadota bacterium]
MSHDATSRALFARAEGLLPGGVSSPVRAFRGVGGTPRFMRRGEGPYLIDADGNRLVDLVCSWGPLILGHAHPEVVEAVSRVLRDGSTFGAPTEIELELAERVVATFPAIDLVRFVSSGTEAGMSVVRLARGATGRTGLVKFDGCYHGHADPLLAAAGSGVATLGLPDSAGVSAATTADTIVVPFNDLEAVERVFAARGDQIAAILLEAVAGNMGVVPPAPGFLAGLRAIADRHGALLVIDEVMTGWRVDPAGAQVRYDVRPDLVCLGKVIGGGFPAAAYGGRRDLMLQVAPVGPVYQAGTLSGNPVAMAAGLATLDVLARGEAWPAADRFAAALEAGLREAAERVGIPLTVQRVGTMLTPFFTEDPVRNYADARAADAARYGRFFHAMLDAGVYLPPSAF